MTLPSLPFTAADRELLLALRRDLHRSPELSWQEQGTQARLERALREIGIADIQRIAKTGLVACVPGRGADGPITAIRGDIDALPIQEATGLPFASTVPGLMHACGHDVHATWAVGAALLLVREPALGEVRIILQPAEEVGEGAPLVLQSGALTNVRAIFGAHVDWRFDVGTVVADAGPLAASTDSFSVTFHGRGGHGARPQECRDPIVGLATFVTAAQTLVSRRLDPALPGVVSIGILSAGQAPNVIPASARSGGTIRATTPATRALLCQELEQMAHDVARVHGLSAEFTLSEGTPPLVNPATGAQTARAAAAAILGDEAVRPLGLTNMGGEDFAFYLEQMDGCFLRIGTRSGPETSHGVHSPHFRVDEEAIFIGAAILAESARRASARP